MKTDQELAIEKTQGPCIIIAGAGTGKTYTLKQKIAYLLNEKDKKGNPIRKPSEILCLTFSNEATNNLRRQVLEQIPHATDVKIRTFHGFCSDILKEFGHLVGVKPSFEVLLPGDARVWAYRYLDLRAYDADSYIKSMGTTKDFGISLTKIEEHLDSLKKKLAVVKDIEKHAKELELELNTLHLRPQDTKEQKKVLRDRKSEINDFLTVYHDYEKYRDYVDFWKKFEALKKEKDVLDFSDLNTKVLELFRKFGNQKLSERYKYVLVDEFQDTNKQQFELLEYIAAHKNITVVGDPNQSIYGFRGAYRESFKHFKEVFEVNEKKDVFHLDKSRRSPNTVLRAAHKLIQKNYEKPDECIIVQNFEGREGTKVAVVEMVNGAEEARKVAELVEAEVAKKTPLNEICVLHRTFRQSVLIKQALEAKNIKTISAGSTDLMQKPEIRTVIAYLSILNNIWERTGTGEQAWWDLFHYHNALLPEDSIKIGRFLNAKRKEKISIDWAILNHLNTLDLTPSSKRIIKRLTDKLHDLLKRSNAPLPDLILDIYEMVGLNRAFTHTRSIRNTEALMNLRDFHEITAAYVERHEKTLPAFIAYLEVLDKLGVDIPASKIQDVNAVRIMTIHAVKGLEFKTVIVTNMAETRFPLARTYREPLIPKELNPDIKRHLETLGSLTDDEKADAIKEYEKQTLLWEERRLCYVAITRAKEQLIMTFARSYNAEPDSTTASGFLLEMDYLNNPDLHHVKDNDEKCSIFAPCSELEQHKSLLKQQFIQALDSDDFQALLGRLTLYVATREGAAPDVSKVNWKDIIDKTELDTHIKKCEGCSCIRFDPSNFKFSPTALLVYDKCPKKYELSQIFHMPERGAFGGGSAADTGTFIHDVLEFGVKEQFSTLKQFKDYAKKQSLIPKNKGMDLDDVNQMLDVFWERNKDTYNDKTEVERYLDCEIEGFKFNGKADRIDHIDEKDIEIIDYKTNNSPVGPRDRSWQLGFYALAAKKQLGLNPVRVRLEMLRLEKPLVAEIDKAGNATIKSSKGFTLPEVEKEIVACAKAIVHDYETEFLPSVDDSPCRYCGYKFYCPKWKEE